METILEEFAGNFFMKFYVKTNLYFIPCTRCGNSVGRVSAAYASGLQVDPQVKHILLWIFFPSSTDSKRANCQLLAKEWTSNTGQLTAGGLPRKSVFK